MCKNKNVFSIRLLQNHFRIPATELFFKDLGNGKQTVKKLAKQSNICLCFQTNVWRKLFILTISIRDLAVLVSRCDHKCNDRALQQFKS